MGPRSLLKLLCEFVIENFRFPCLRISKVSYFKFVAGEVFRRDIRLFDLLEMLEMLEVSRFADIPALLVGSRAFLFNFIKALEFKNNLFFNFWTISLLSRCLKVVWTQIFCW